MGLKKKRRSWIEILAVSNLIETIFLALTLHSNAQR